MADASVFTLEGAFVVASEAEESKISAASVELLIAALLAVVTAPEDVAAVSALASVVAAGNSSETVVEAC